jgi:hypothetical protein
MGFGSCSYMLIPINLAWFRFLGSLYEMAAEGAVFAALVKS